MWSEHWHQPSLGVCGQHWNAAPLPGWRAGEGTGPAFTAPDQQAASEMRLFSADARPQHPAGCALSAVLVSSKSSGHADELSGPKGHLGQTESTTQRHGASRLGPPGEPDAGKTGTNTTAPGHLPSAPLPSDSPAALEAIKSNKHSLPAPEESAKYYAMVS